jgi:KUP system potassium uptake protein
MNEAQAEQVISEHPGRLNGSETPPSKPLRLKQLLLLSVTVLGVVFGDIGTSPLYAFRMCFEGKNGVAATPENVLGILSLIFRALVIVISVKYVLYVMRAQNEGEGGILALIVAVEDGKASTR